MQRPQEAPPASNLAQLGAWGFGVLCVLAVACLFPVGGRGANPFGSAAQQQASLNLHLDTYPELVQSGQQVPSKAVSKNQVQEQPRKISTSALPLHHYWGAEETYQYTPQQLVGLEDMFPAARQLHERYERFALVAEDAALLKESDASFQYALRRIAEKDSLLAKVLAVETLVNQFKYFAEPTRMVNGTLQQEDHWMLPREFLDPKYGGAKGGDCEDFALYKYGLLLESGIPVHSMKIVAVKALTAKGFIGHAVLVVQDPEQGVMYVLDSLRVLGQTPVYYNTTYEPLYTIGPASVALFASSAITREP